MKQFSEQIYSGLTRPEEFVVVPDTDNAAHNADEDKGMNSSIFG
ncbi:hypothetical protein ACFQ1H_02275 [Scardovia wiggsiae]